MYNIMKIEFIYTYNSSSQEFEEFPFDKSILKDKQTLFDFATAHLTQEEKFDLIKITNN